MKRVWIIAVVLLLAGCTAPKDYETMSDVYQEPQVEAREVSVSLPEDQTVTAMTDAAGGTLYICDGYSVLVETLDAGDLDRTLRQVSGFNKDKLQIIVREEENVRRMECVWAAAGEGEDQIGRAVILDDGYYHYTLTFMSGASKAAGLTDQWQEIADSFSLGIGK